MKKLAAILIAAAVLVSSAVPAFAHGGCGGGQFSGGGYPVCGYDGCASWDLHTHDGVGYYDHDICAVDGCGLFGLHEHDGVYYYGAGDNFYGTGGGCCGGRWR